MEFKHIICVIYIIAINNGFSTAIHLTYTSSTGPIITQPLIAETHPEPQYALAYNIQDDLIGNKYYQDNANGNIVEETIGAPYVANYGAPVAPAIAPVAYLNYAAPTYTGTIDSAYKSQTPAPSRYPSNGGYFKSAHPHYFKSHSAPIFRKFVRKFNKFHKHPKFYRLSRYYH